MSALEYATVDHVGERDALAELLRLHLTSRSTPRRCEWLYDLNPFGVAEVYAARDRSSGEIVGSGAVIPLRVAGASDEPSTIVAGMADFWVHPSHRSLGPASRLQRGCVDAAARRCIGFLDLPQGTMAAVYARLRLAGRTTLDRLVVPLRIEPFLANRVAHRTLARVAGWAGDPVLRLRRRVRAVRSRSVVEIMSGRFGPEFDAPGFASTRQRCIARTSAFLNWRYRDHYLLEYVVLTARRAGRVVGYAVLLLEADYAEVMDLRPFDDVDTAGDLLCAASEEMRARGAIALSTSWLGGTEPPRAMQEAGFRVRGSRPFVLREFTDSGATCEPAPGAWTLTYGDIDY